MCVNHSEKFPQSSQPSPHFFQTYFNSDVLNLVRSLVTGGVNSELESQFAEGREVPGMFETADIATFRNRAKLTQVTLQEGPMQKFGVSYYSKVHSRFSLFEMR